MSCEQDGRRGWCEWVEAVLGWYVVAGSSGQGGGSREKNTPVTYEVLSLQLALREKKMKC